MNALDVLKHDLGDVRVRVAHAMGAVVRLCIAAGCPRRTIEQGAGVPVGGLVRPLTVRQDLDEEGKRALHAAGRACRNPGHTSRLRDGRCGACYQAAWERERKRMTRALGCDEAEAYRLLAWLDWVLVTHARVHGDATMGAVAEVAQRARAAGCDLSAWGPGGLA